MISNPAERLSLSLVTPNFNGEAFLRSTFESVASQAVDGLEYIFVDGASADRSMELAGDYKDLITTTISEPDKGHADALNKGFAVSSGDIMGWINSDDVLLPGCLETVRRVFETFPEIEWITGRPSTMNERGELTDVRPARPWSRRRFLCGDHLWIQQESTFWRRSLWERAGGQLDTEFEVANDFELWARFFRHADLYTVDRMLGCFRVREGQRSTAHRARYFDEVNQILRRELDALPAQTRELLRDTLPAAPMVSDAHDLKTREDQLSVDDPPILTSAILRKGQLDTSLVKEARFQGVNDDREGRDRSLSGWSKTLKRNWRFVAGLGAAGALLAVLASLLPDHATTLILVSLTALCLVSTAIIAIKVRRIVKQLERSVERALGGRARAELRNQTLQAEIDALHDAVKKARD